MNDLREEELAKVTDLDLWTQALPLAKALNRFGPPALVAALAAHPQKPATVYLRPLLSPKNGEMGEALAKAAQKVKQDADSHLEARRNLEAAVLALYRSGDLLLLGFDGPRSLQSLPVRVLPHVVRQSPDWENGSYRHDGLNLTQLRMIETPEEIRHIAKVEQVRLGRPGIGQQVQAAFAAMLAAGKINPETSARNHYPLLRQMMKDAGDDEAMHRSDEGLRAHFSPLFNELKKTRKQ